MTVYSQVSIAKLMGGRPLAASGSNSQISRTSSASRRTMLGLSVFAAVSSWCRMERKANKTSSKTAMLFCTHTLPLPPLCACVPGRIKSVL